jgi:hypothetical protein
LADYQAVLNLRNESTIFRFEGAGNPPQKYRFTFHGLGFAKDQRERIHIVDTHHVLIELGAAYPRLVPNLVWQSPIYHPNISINGVVCLGGYGTHWVPSLALDEMCGMLWDMIRYKNFDTESPFNREAAVWAKTQTAFKFPIDPRSIRDKISQPQIPLTYANQPQLQIVESGIEIISRGNRNRPSDEPEIVFLN